MIGEYSLQIKMTLKEADKKLIEKLKDIGPPILRYSLAIVFIWFGALKPLSLSPAQDLVANTIYFFNPNWFVPFLGIWEVALDYLSSINH
jgi:hypothetical protein